MKNEMDTTQLITTQIDPCNLAATSGMLISHSSDKDLAKQFSKQVVHQLAIQGLDPETVMLSMPMDHPMVSFQIPVCVLMHVSDTLVDLAKSDMKASAAWLMKAWAPALLQVVGLVWGISTDEDRGPFDSMGRCMN